MQKKDIKLRIMEKVKVNPHSQCWEWQGALHRGYGEISVNGESYKIHRVSYETFIGKIPDGLVIDHLCRNRRCVNPTHLEPVTLQENTRRGDWIASINRRKTHCVRGHQLSGENMKWKEKVREGRLIRERRCLECETLWNRIMVKKREERAQGIHRDLEEIKKEFFGE